MLNLNSFINLIGLIKFVNKKIMLNANYIKFKENHYFLFQEIKLKK